MSDPLRVVLIGAGGVGIRLAKDIARTLEFQREYSALIIIDGDCYEPDNLKRQEFAAIGNKAEVLAGELDTKFTNTYVIPEAGWVVAEDDSEPEEEEQEEVPEGQTNKKIVASKLLEEGDIVFVTVDNFAARKAVFDAARHLDNIDCLTGGNDDALFGSTYHYRRRDGKDITDHPAELPGNDEYINPPDKNPGDLNCQERAELEGGEQTIAANAAVAAFLMGRMHMILADKDITPASEIFFDLEKGMASANDRSAVPEEEGGENVSDNKVLEGV